jgi:hypothetical protein
MLFIKVHVAPRVKYSPKKIEVGRERKTEKIRAKKETISVPTTKGSAPNSPLTGSHVDPERNPTPK